MINHMQHTNFLRIEFAYNCLLAVQLLIEENYPGVYQQDCYCYKCGRRILLFYAISTGNAGEFSAMGEPIDHKGKQAYACCDHVGSRISAVRCQNPAYNGSEAKPYV